MLTVLAAVALAVGASAQGAARSAGTEVIGAKVIGPSMTPLGTVTGLVRDERSGSVVMYTVKSTSLFGGSGVIPTSHVLDQRAMVGKDGETRYRLDVSVNKATFKNIAKWSGQQSLASYLEARSRILATVYGIRAAELERSLEYYVVDSGEGRFPASSVASL